MNLTETLRKPPSLLYADALAGYINDNPHEFVNLFNLMFDADKTLAWRTGWICDKISRKNPEWFTVVQMQKIFEALLTEKHNGTLRSLLSIFHNIYNGTQLSVEIINLLFGLMTSARSDVSHQVLSMKILARYCENEPDMIPELLAYLQLLSPDDFTPGFNSVRKKILNRLIKKQLQTQLSSLP